MHTIQSLFFQQRYQSAASTNRTTANSINEGKWCENCVGVCERESETGSGRHVLVLDMLLMQMKITKTLCRYCTALRFRDRRSHFSLQSPYSQKNHMKNRVQLGPPAQRYELQWCPSQGPWTSQLTPTLHLTV